ncbi:MAG: hypothetical protein CVU11_00380 [Bacteroidetes bacterium HGW-Bacteroidetes-6]|jgi:hypothetical protein|nr:MAG: hypothetical protein CVU11_00380 [Bacteroidetes bacterium HGW-Bacteroidetes-6]
MKAVVFAILTLLVAGLHAQMSTAGFVHNALSDSVDTKHSSMGYNRDPFYFFSGERQISLYPMAFSEAMAGSGLPYSAGAGVWVGGSINNNAHFKISPAFTHAVYPKFIGEKFDSLNFFPGEGRTLYSSGKSNGYLSVPVMFTHELSPVFTLRAGNEKTFLGDGYRSMLLSDQGAEYPFVRIEANLNQLRYQHQISRWRQQMPDGHSETKFSATHYLSWMINSKLNLSFFESVVWKAEDSVRQRGFEWLYLNPVLFFRPAEFALGSPDNMLIGGNISWNIFPKTKLYGQILLDEFFISEIKNWIKHSLHPSDSSIPYGAWVNKQAFQIGIKSVGLFGIGGLNALAEFNFARPYVFSHRDPMMSYTNMNQPVAHPLGANFYEFVFRSQYKKEKWSAHFNAMYYVTGLDSAGTHFGQDLLQSTFDGPVGNGNIPVQYYGNVVGQGVRHNIIQTSAEYRRMFRYANTSFVWRLGVLYRNDQSEVGNSSEMYVYTGIFLNLRPGEWNFR